jgi:S-adenosylmethionine synthetase
VGPGHPDKICDQISDAVLDECLRQDHESHVACECFATDSLIVVGGEILTTAYVDIQKIAKDVLRDIGYVTPSFGLDYKTVTILNAIKQQSPDIDRGVMGRGEYIGQMGAGDQGIMFGYACNETEEYMPLAITLAHDILKELEITKNLMSSRFYGPDCKSQVTVKYDEKDITVDSIVVAQQHTKDRTPDQVKEFVTNACINVLAAHKIKASPNYYINATGAFHIGGPIGDTGLTGRKIIVDTYGGYGHHGGGAFSGKDPSKVDRSGAYMARYIAKNICAAANLEWCEVQLAYAIGVPFPVSVNVKTNSDWKFNKKLEDIIPRIFDCSPAGIIQSLDLKRPIYRQTATYGHFGKPGDYQNIWELLNKVEDIRKLI